MCTIVCYEISKVFEMLPMKPFPKEPYTSYSLESPTSYMHHAVVGH